MTTFLVQEDTYNTNNIDFKIRGIPDSFSTFVIDFKAFFGVKPQHVSRRFSISLSDLSYQPKVCSHFPLHPSFMYQHHRIDL